MMPGTSRRVPPPPPPDEPAVEPPYYEATEDLFVYSPEAGAMPMAAYRKGDRVVPDVIGPNHWGGKVRVPDAFIGQLSPIPAEQHEPSSPEPPAEPAVKEKE
jgi:hypothetical protein